MKKIVKILPILVCLFIVGCSTENERKVVTKNRKYDEIMEYKIDWFSALLIAKSRYFVYIYSITCSHCIEIKNEIISYRVDQNYPIYFCEFNKNIPIVNSTETTIGTSDISNVGILGTPSLLTIENNTVISNVAGKNDILSEILL